MHVTPFSKVFKHEKRIYERRLGEPADGTAGDLSVFSQQQLGHEP
jgi:hypothetical protein